MAPPLADQTFRDPSPSHETRHWAGAQLNARFVRPIGQPAMSAPRWWLICYDVRDERRLRRCAKLLEGYGERIQFSVFRCWLNRRSLEKLRWELTELLSPDDDFLMVPLCSNCVDGIVARSRTAIDWPPTPPRFHIT